MISALRKVSWWFQRRRKEDELLEELEFHLAEEVIERQGCSSRARVTRELALSSASSGS
jgi:hypothetical protein